jgi:hypothetical protein
MRHNSFKKNVVMSFVQQLLHTLPRTFSFSLISNRLCKKFFCSGQIFSSSKILWAIHTLDNSFKLLLMLYSLNKTFCQKANFISNLGQSFSWKVIHIYFINFSWAFQINEKKILYATFWRKILFAEYVISATSWSIFSTFRFANTYFKHWLMINNINNY